MLARAGHRAGTRLGVTTHSPATAASIKRLGVCPIIIITIHVQDSNISVVSKKMFVGGKKRFRHRELNPDLLGENQISWPLDYNGGYKYSLNMYQVLTGLNTEVTAAAASGCTWNKMELILLKNFIEVDSLFERIKRQTIDS